MEGGDCNDSDSTIHPNADSNWDNAFFDEDCDHIVQPTLKTSQSNWGVSEQRTLFVVSQENDMQPISISKQSIHLLNFPSGQENSISLPGLELTSFATGKSGNIAVLPRLLGEIKAFYCMMLMDASVQQYYKLLAWKCGFYL